jgi:hypothetical protein
VVENKEIESGADKELESRLNNLRRWWCRLWWCQRWQCWQCDIWCLMCVITSYIWWSW